jgi:hypothetical protein
VICAVCGGLCAVVEHAFRPGWVYEAPVYHIINRETMRGEPFCGSECATKWHEDLRDLSVLELQAVQESA